MRLLITLFMMTYVAAPAVAKSNSNSKKPAAVKKAGPVFSGKLLTYSQLMYLTPKKRMAYIRGMVELMITMESFTNQYSVAQRGQLQDMREQVAGLMKQMELMPQAFAREDEGLDDDAPGAINDLPLSKIDYTKVYPAWNGQEYLCGSGMRFDYKFGTCVLENKSRASTTFNRSNDADASAPGNEICPAGTREVPHYQSVSSACVPSGSWERLNKMRQQALLNGKFLNPSVARRYSPEQQQEAFLGGAPPVAPMPTALDPKSLPAGPGALAQVVPDESGRTPGVKVPGGVTPDGAKNGGKTPESAQAPEKADDDKAEGEKSEGGKAEAAKPDAAKPEVPKAAEAAEAAKCAPQPQQCKDPDSEEVKLARRNFYNNSSSNIYIAGGFSSKYKGSKKEAGGCLIPRSMKLGEGRPDFKCEDGEELCNPVLFCATGKLPGKKASPVIFCTEKAGRGSNRPITEQCSRHYQALLKGHDKPGGRGVFSCKVPKRGKTENAADFDKRKLEAAKECEKNKVNVVTPCDPKNMPAGMTKLPDEWAKLIADLDNLRNSFCQEKDAKVFFCKECEIINERVFAMTKAANGSGCDPAPVAAPATDGEAPAQRDGDGNLPSEGAAKAEK